MADRPIVQQITFLDTRDLARTAEFYEGVLGLRLARDQGTCRIYHVSGNAYLGFCQRADAPERRADAPEPAAHPTAPQRPGDVVITLISEDVDGWCAHLRSRGVVFVKEPADNPPYRIYNAFVRDPSGYLIEIQRFWEPLA